ncbi:CBF/Mak21 family-domain-containing protein [Xylaria arbuscula]|nr:CBF/Mak21 family-domain-containing protein [Xylaria arbuscula]
MATFDEAALSKLTAKLDSKLAEVKNPKGKRKLDQSADIASPPAKKRNQPRKPDHSPKGKPNGKFSGKPNGNSNGKPHSKPFAKPNAFTKPNVQSRDRSSKPPTKNQNAPQRDDANFLLDEIKALGGDEEDYKLIEDIDSDDDAVNNQTASKDADKRLRDELASFAAGLGFDQVAQEAVDEESDAADDQDNENVPGNEDNDNEEEEVEEEEAEEEDDEPEDLTKPIPKGKTIFEPRPDWYAVELKTLPNPASDDVAPFTTTMTALKNYAKTILDEDTAAYGTSFAASSSRKFMSTIMSSGTMSDKVSALTLAIQESPAHNIKAFENLMAMGAKRSRGPALAALTALVDLLGPGMILPSDRRLRTFTSQLGLIGTLQKLNIRSWSAGQPLPGKVTRAHLISWYFEDWLKDAYFKMIQSLEVWCDDEVDYARTKAVDQVYALLRDKPEQESNLLRLLVNKLGDRDRKIASRSSYLLLQLVTTHPRMKQVVVRSIEQDVIFRSGQNNRAKYYAVNTLNQTILSTKEPELADSLLRIYFGMFLSLLKSGELGHLDSAIDGSKPEKKGKNKRRPRPSKDTDDKSKPSAAGAGETEAAEKLVSAILTGVNRAVPFSQADQSTLESHLDTLFRITHSSNFNTSIQALMLIQQLSVNRQLATERYYRTLYESLLDPRLITSSKQALYLNLLYRSLKADVDVRRVKAFVKRMLQILNLHQPSFVCGIIYLAIELSLAFPDIKTLLTVPEENDVEETTQPAIPDALANSISDGLQDRKAANAYDGRKRDPEYSNAHLSCLWELLPFLKHYHPSVDVYARNLLNGEKANQKPELANHTLIAFLDKFVYKNAKAADQAKGTSIMQPIAASGQSQVLLSSKSSMKDIDSVNSASFWNKKSGDIAVEDAFFHEYFTQMGKPGQEDRKLKKKKDAAGEEEEDEEAKEDEIWDALVNSRPEIQEDSDDGADFDDMMSLDDGEKEFRKAMDENDDDDDDGFNLDDSDMEISDDEIDEDEDEEDEEPAAQEEKEEKPVSERTKKRKALKALPLFASADDYAEMLAKDDM